MNPRQTQELQCISILYTYETISYLQEGDPYAIGQTKKRHTNGKFIRFFNE